MRTSVSAGYWSAGPPPGAPGLFEAAERIGIDQIWTAEAYGSDAWTPLAWWGSRPAPGHPGHDRDDDGPPHRRPGTARHRHQQPPGGGGMVRRAVSPAAGAHQGVHRHRPPGHRAPRAGQLRREALPAPAAAGKRRHRPGEAAALDPAPVPHRDPDLPRRGGPEERGPGGRDRRRLERHFLLAE